MRKRGRTVMKLNNLKSGFSLAELLVVIVIMSVLAAVAMPAFNMMMGGTGIQGATQDVKAMISQARQYAIMNNTPTHFVIASSDSLLSSDDQDKWMRAYCVYDARKEQFVKAWKYLPDGIVFDTNDGGLFQNATEIKLDNNILLSDSTPSEDHDFGSNTVSGNHWISFSPNGRSNWERVNGKYADDLGSVHVVIAEGFTVPADSSGGYQKYPNGGHAGVSVSRNTGRAVAKIL